MLDPLPLSNIGQILHSNAMIQDGQYFFTSHLMALDTYRPTQGGAATCVDNCSTGNPLNIAEWVIMLKDHPDESYTQYIVKGIRTRRIQNRI